MPNILRARRSQDLGGIVPPFIELQTSSLHWQLLCPQGYFVATSVRMSFHSIANTSVSRGVSPISTTKAELVRRCAMWLVDGGIGIVILGGLLI
ncbi:hypothetical protein K461DRAFT_47033 [Myriangium duriaei CBS 260.36]|uniref:Uncharacterized protein n=1 Tax=Myriangium duriaei CBS 260.36 TaxID=1168546 RepID=A0A9P4IX61_9PEZI|nr:hypothetical protein K461DRAFT_47033 [Myriangium duriaei CBS 260.36]